MSKIQFLKIEVEEIPENYQPYLEDYFTNLKISKNNFYTDISNYLAYEIGQPTHCYDFNKVKDGINLTTITEKTSFTTLFNKNIELEPGEKVFKNSDDVINFAGVMGGNSTKCNSDTKIALVECAFFNPDMVIGKSTKYDLNSDAAYKFERGTDINCHEYVLRRFINIVNDHVKIKSIAIKSEIYSRFVNKEIEKDYSRINKILGTNLSNDDIDNILTNLGFSIDCYFVVPSWRTDIESINDLAEEVARVIGYDEINISNLKTLKRPSNKSCSSKINIIRRYLIREGFNEIINDPFVAENQTISVKVDNPLDSSRKFLRLNLVNSLIKNLDYNEKRQKDIIKFFEISDIYTKNAQNQKIDSKKLLSIIISGRKGLNHIDFNTKLDRNYLKNIISKFGLNDSYVKEFDRTTLNSKIKNKIYYVECDIADINEKLLDNSSSTQNFLFNKYKPISEFPSSQRDLSISIDNETILKKVTDTIFNLKLVNIKDLFIFDFYHNKNDNILKIGFRFIFSLIKEH